MILATHSAFWSSPIFLQEWIIENMEITTSTKLTELLLTKYQHILSKYPLEKKLTVEDIVEDIIDYYESIISCMPGNVYWFDNEGLAVGCSQQVLNMFGFKSPQEFKGLSFEDMGKIGKWPSDAKQSFKDDTLEVIKCGKPKLNVKEPPIPHNDGRTIYYLSSRVPLTDTNGNIIGVVGISTDITELTNIQESLKIAKKETETANQALLLIASSIAHELRTPLSAVSSGMAGITKHLPKLISAYECAKAADLPIDFIPNHQITSLKSIATNLKNEVNYANLMINMLLVKIKKPDSSPMHQICSINDCIQKVFQRYPLTLDEQQLIYWTPGNDFQFKGNELMVIHIFFNLLKNSLYYIKAAGKGQINIWLETGTIHNKIYFKDTGKGIPKKILPHIFNPFYSKTEGGTGIGLSFCEAVMAEIGGEISCQSIENEYCLFTLTFPCYQ